MLIKDDLPDKISYKKFFEGINNSLKIPPFGKGG
jgi:hypothetical protein